MSIVVGLYFITFIFFFLILGTCGWGHPPTYHGEHFILHCIHSFFIFVSLSGAFLRSNVQYHAFMKSLVRLCFFRFFFFFFLKYSCLLCLECVIIIFIEMSRIVMTFKGLSKDLQSLVWRGSVFVVLPQLLSFK